MIKSKLPKFDCGLYLIEYFDLVDAGHSENPQEEFPGLPKSVYDTLMQRYIEEWGEGAVINPERLSGELILPLEETEAAFRSREYELHFFLGVSSKNWKGDVSEEAEKARMERAKELINLMHRGELWENPEKGDLIQFQLVQLRKWARGRFPDDPFMSTPIRLGSLRTPPGKR